MLLKGTTAAALGVVANNAGVGSAGRPYFYVYDGTRYRVVIGELNSDGWGGAGTASDSMGMKIWDSAGAKLVEFSDVANVISGWAVTSAAVTSTGKFQGRAAGA